jgi:hypothetical protein
MKLFAVFVYSFFNMTKGRKPSRVEILKFLVKTAGGRKNFASKTNVKESNLADYLSGKKPFTQAWLHKTIAALFELNREVLRLVVNWAGSRDEFRRRSRIQHSNLSDYLNGRKPVGEKTLKKYVQSYFANEPIQPIRERHDSKDLQSLPASSGLYAFFDSGKRLIYFGKATNLKTEIKQTLNRAAPKQLWNFRGDKAIYEAPKFKEITKYYSAYKVIPDSEDLRHHLESFVLRLALNLTLNQRTGKLRVSD